MLIYLLIITISFIFCTYFFLRGSGTLHIGKLNVISISYFLFIVQLFIGTALIMLGFDQHYTLRKLIDRSGSINIMFYVVMITAVVWPLIMWLFLKLFKLNVKTKYKEYLDKQTIISSDKTTFWIIMALGALCLGLLAIYLYKIGYVPLLKMIRQPGFSFSTERININNTYIINIYVRNILILLAIPVLSYITFGYALATREKKWIVLAIILFLASVITKTYNFEKSPIVFHMMVYVLIFAYFKGGIKTKWMIPIIGAGFTLLLAGYMFVTQGVYHSLYDGAGGRLLFSQVGALAYNFDVFPNYFPFLMGRSLSTTILSAIGADPELHIRSARLVMEFYSPEGVYEGVAGVMNSFYIGEAYANFGWAGAIFSIIWTAFIISGLYLLILKIRKTPVNLALAAYVSIYVATAVHGGFMDFIYNVSWITVIGGLLILEYHPGIIKTVKSKLVRLKQPPVRKRV